MVLMSPFRSMVLYALVTAALTDAIGLSRDQVEGYKINNNMVINQKPPPHKILLNLNGPPLVTTITELQSVFRDEACRDCTKCMERTIESFRSRSYITNNRPNDHELYYELINNSRSKRNAPPPKEKVVQKGNSFKATVTKYMKDKKVYAMEVKENDAANTCKIYSVKKVLPCNSGMDVISASKGRINKKSKKSKDTSSVTAATERAKSKLSVYKKREVDNSQGHESYMSSIEDMY